MASFTDIYTDIYQYSIIHLAAYPSKTFDSRFMKWLQTYIHNCRIATYIVGTHDIPQVLYHRFGRVALATSKDIFQKAGCGSSAHESVRV